MRRVDLGLVVVLSAGCFLVPALGSTDAPLVFERNDGQVASRALYLARGPGYDLFLEATGVTIAPHGGESPIRMRFEGTADATVRGLRPSGGHSHYLRGSDPDAWIRDAPHYGAVRYSGLYPGVDVLFRGDDAGRVEFDLMLSGGARLDGIALAVDGDVRLSTEPDGTLRMETATGVLRQTIPAIYVQDARGRRALTGRAILDGRRVRFAIDDHDAEVDATWVIDPVLDWSTYLGGASGPDYPRDVTIGADGAIYVAGTSQAPDYPSVGGMAPMQGNGPDVFVTKLSADGTTVIYSTFLGGVPVAGFPSSGADEARAIAVDALGRAYLAGYTEADRFPVTPGAFRSTGDFGFPLHQDGFFSVLSADGASLVYSTYFGGNHDDWPEGVAVGDDGRAYVTGLTRSEDFPTTAGTLQPTFDPESFSEGFVTEFGIELTGADSIVRSTLLSGGFAEDIALAPGGDVVLTGRGGNGLVTTPQAYLTELPGPNAFVARIDPDLTVRRYVSYFGGEDNEDPAFSVATDARGRIYIGGMTRSSDFPTTPGAYLESAQIPGGGGYGYVAKFDPDLDGDASLVFSTFLATYDFYDEIRGVALDSREQVVVTALGGGPDVNPDPATGDGQVLVAILDRAGSNLLYSDGIGGVGVVGSEEPAAVAVGPADTIGVVGSTSTVDFPTTPGTYQENLAGDYDGFVTVLTPSTTTIAPAGSVGGLVVGKGNGGRFELVWDPSCSGSDGDYSIQEGRIGDFGSHAPLVCSTRGAISASVRSEVTGDSYFLIVPSNGTHEGSYGVASDGTERLTALRNGCFAQELGACP